MEIILLIPGWTLGRASPRSAICIWIQNLQRDRGYHASVWSQCVTCYSACTATEAPLEIDGEFLFPDLEPEPQIDAATIDPCASQFAFQRELNGAPDDTSAEISTADGMSLTILRYWYADTRMVVNFTYAADETWCNVWNESGVRWNN